MTKIRTLIIHGWSDCSESFVGIKNFLTNSASNLGEVLSFSCVTDDIFFVDYKSREDNLTFNDVAHGLNNQLINNKIIDEDGNKLCDLNVIVHSTGGLIIRHWLWRYYVKEKRNIDNCPVKRIVMLAPANFGSPLAHQGKSFLGNLFAGRWKFGDLFEAGKQILDGLELASQYQWDLTHRDLLIDDPIFNSKAIQATILVGIEDYSGYKGWVNKPGTDGTVVISGTNLNPAKLILNFSSGRFTTRRWEDSKCCTETAFAVLEKFDHGSIIEKFTTEEKIYKTVIEALNPKTPDEFKDFIQKLNGITEQTYSNVNIDRVNKSRYQQFIVRAIDDQESPVFDFRLEFDIVKISNITNNLLPNSVVLTEEEENLGNRANSIITSEFHKNQLNGSYRRFLLDIDKINNLFNEARTVLNSHIALVMKLSIPDIDRGIHYNKSNLNNIVLYRTDITQEEIVFIYPNTTTFIEVRVNRDNSYVRLGIEPRREEDL